MEEHFGEHLTIDGYHGSFIKLWNREIIYNCLNQLPEALGMHKITTPHVIAASANDGKDPGGFSGYVMIAESHISIHTFPAKGFVSIDVYTCRNGLKIDIITEYFTKQFGLRDVEVNLIKRGTRFPRHNIYDENTGELLDDDEKMHGGDHIQKGKMMEQKDQAT